MNTTNLPKWNLAVHDSGPVVVLTRRWTAIREDSDQDKVIWLKIYFRLG